jgi:tetratricopeptide (TPR) repeat protein
MVAISFRSKLEVPDILTELLVDGAIYLWERGLLDQGYELIASAEEICSIVSNCSQPLRAAVYSFRGCILSDRGLIDEASECFKQEVNYRREHLRSLTKAGKRPTIVDEIQLANGYNNLAGIFCACGSFTEAEIYNELSLQIKERWRKRGNLEYLLSLSYSNRANVLGLQQKWSEAASWYQKALDIPREKQYGPRLALIYHNFGTMRLQQGHLDEATKLLTEAVELRTENLGYHYDTANSLHTLAACYRKSGKLVEARDVLVEALKMLDSPHLRVLERLGDSNASALRQEARDIRAQLGSKPVLARGEGGDDGEEDYDALVPYV